MSQVYGILADLDPCVACYACEVACKEENDVPIGTKRIQIVPIGPERVDGKLRMDFIPMLLEGCTLCEHRIKENMLPRCVENCPTQAMVFCRNTAEMVAALQSGKRFQVCKVKGQWTAD
jgi:Fe-S-cluster-containing dehydrogenase component